jgi:PDZ domain-containing protein
LIAFGLLVAGAAALVLWLAPSDDYILLPDKARPVAPLVTVAKHRQTKTRDEGEIYFLAVTVRKATLLEQLFPWLRDDATLVPASAIRPPGVSEKTQERIDTRAMSRSQTIAAAVALDALHQKVVVRPAGARIARVFAGMPAAKRLQRADLIVDLDGRPVRNPCALRQLIGMHRPGDRVRVTVRRGNSLRTVRLRTAADPDQPNRPVIGVLLDQGADIQLPFSIRIRSGGVVGPSAGLAFALEIMEKLGRNVDRGYRIAATGELELGGCVVPIGGEKQKAIEAARAHVDILLIPAGENATEAKRYAKDVRVIPVKSFQQALHSLATLPPKS